MNPIVSIQLPGEDFHGRKNPKPNMSRILSPITPRVD